MSTITLRPQALGIFPLPAGYLLLPNLEGAAAMRDMLLRGQMPEHASQALSFYQAALHGDIDAAWMALAQDDSPEADYNRFVLRGEPEYYEQLRGMLSGDMAQLCDMVAYTLGILSTPPDVANATDELRAVLLSAQAAHAIEQDDETRAEQSLSEAVQAARPVSPLLAAQLLADLADLRWQQRGPDADSLHHYQEAMRLLQGTALKTTRAHMALKLGICYQELAHGQREALLEAVRHYQDALQVFSAAHEPELFALVQNNLALAYLAMPLTEASDQLRVGIAVQALRAALTIYTRDAYPEQWASTQLNLANALQYLPSSHPEDNLAEAVGLYEEILQARSKVNDPAGYARLLSNQGNALAHLGIFEHARPKLREAAQLFAVVGDGESVQAVQELLEQCR